LNANGKLGLKRGELNILDLRAAGPTNQFNARRKYAGTKKDLLVQLIEPMKVTSVRRDHLRKANAWLA
jgi:hypothetical protein